MRSFRPSLRRIFETWFLAVPSVIKRAREISRLRTRANALIAQECGKTVEQVEADTNRDHWMNPEEACEYGLCSRVIQSIEELDSK